MNLELKNIKQDFPILHDNDLIYLDNASTTQKPKYVLDQINNMYSKTNANVHRALYSIGSIATNKFENARKKVASFIKAESENEIVFTSGTTESLNLLARTIGDKLKPGDEILISEMEHHANIVPWQMACKRTGAILSYLPVNSNGELDLSQLNIYLNTNTKIVSLTHVSNVLGTMNPLKEIAKIAHQNGALFIVDGAQAVPHHAINVQELDCDFYTFSGHKMLGPTGIGVLWGKKELLEEMEPFMGGGEMIEKVTMKSSTWNTVPHKFEAGTPNYVQAIGLGAAIEYLENIGMSQIANYINTLTSYTLKKLSDMDDIKIFGPSSSRTGIISFNINGIHPHDLAQFLNEDNIAIRVGHHCAQPLLYSLKETSIARLSIYIYNNQSDIDKFCKSLQQIKDYF